MQRNIYAPALSGVESLPHINANVIRYAASVPISKGTTMKTLLVPALAFSLMTCACTAAFAQDQTYAERLGWPKGARVVIFHVDDAGMSHDSNVGTIEAMEQGVATSTSVMYPCPWVVEMAQYAKKHPDADIGLHSTFTAEWDIYRWGPIAGKKAVPGLVDEEGCLWHGEDEAAKNATPDEVETELRAQLDRATTMDLKPTHIDTHMGTVFTRPDFLERYVRVSAENGIPVMVPGGHAQYLTQNAPELVGGVKALGEMVWALGLPVLDDVHTGFGCENPADKKAQILAFLHDMKPGLTQFIVHCTRPSENFKNIAGSGPMRLAELEALTAPEVKKAVADEKIILTTWRELKQRRDAVK
jgi:predicted glycoside hydrolase/deacetylase ChbG (UPF0249 family)